MGTRNIKLIVSACTVNFLAFALGNAYAWSSPVLVVLKSNTLANPIGRPVTVSEESWIASLVSLGAATGPVLSGFFAEKFGRKVTLLMFSIPMLFAQIILAFATTPIEFYVARFLCGLGVGCGYTVIPMYIGEIAETKIRGLLGCILGLFSSLGFLFVITIGPFVSIKLLSFILMVPVVLFQIFFGLFIPESPYYYVTVGKYHDASESLKKLRSKSTNFNSKELEEIKESVGKSGDKSASLWVSLRSNSFKKGFTITGSLMVFQQFVGIAFIQSYMELIFLASGGSFSSSGSSMVIALIQVLGVLVSASLVDRWGRKMLLILSSIFCGVSLFVLGLYFYLKNVQDMERFWWIPVSSLGVYIISYCAGICTLPWALVGELFSNETKSIASSITATINLSLAFLVALVGPILKEFVGFEGVFWFFSVGAFLCLFFVLFYIPETKGKSFQEIQVILEH